jgi:asparagine synthase (glutamine-hydrolysing)
MCGLTAVLNLDRDQPAEPAVVAAMRDELAHRGPDETGLHVDGPAGLGFRRLSVIDVPGGHQPMVDEASGVAVVFNGEVYNHLALRRELEARRHRFRTRCDTEVLLRGYLEWGDAVVHRLTGMFAFAIWDPRSRELLLARDRLGIKPLHWTRAGRSVLVASEPRAFLAHPGFRPEADLQGISSYLTFRQPVWGLGYFAGVSKVLPGHWVRIGQDGAVRAGRYWTLPTPQPDRTVRTGTWLERIESTLSTAVSRCLISDVPVAAYLSGGLDSSVMVGLMARLQAGPTATFSAGYAGGDFDEGDAAAAVAASLGTQHRHREVSRAEYLESWPALVRHRAAPLSIPHEVPLYHLSAELKGTASVALAGDGADELFGGYGRVLRSPLDWAKIRLARGVLGPGLSARLASMRPVRDTPLSWVRFGTQLEHFLHVYNWIPLPEKRSLFSADARAVVGDDAGTLAVFEEAFDEVRDADPYDRVLHVFQKIHLGCLLDKLDAMGMAAGVEGRVPFVDHELVEQFVHMPIELKMRWNSLPARLRAVTVTAANASERLDTPKWALRRVGAQLLPPEVAGRAKLGFPTPLDRWLGEGMLGFARDVLLDRRSRDRGIFDPVALAKLLADRQRLPYDFYGKKIWMLTNVELWFREVFDRRS